MNNKGVILVGYCGNGLVVAEAAILQGLKLLYYSEVKERVMNPFNWKYIGNENQRNFKGWDSSSNSILGIGNNQIRGIISALILCKEKTVFNVIHPTAIVSKMSSIGSGNLYLKMLL